ncbi:HAMP domain-containing sensor histidine kinase [Pedobacter sp. SYSU D00535]|uniref:HAMP domain-containing sensor histidine kinase n=1 Tax=Pedobacter sp. SYSU D00535 TaxID=2810308 RepID=UPI001A97AF7C|nr:HAMP domain-containing sensor histidine kinase [Pedobacter sp. SYSU D00535]
MRIQTKITLLFFVVSSFGLIVLNAAIFYFVSQFTFEDFNKRLQARVNFAAQINLLRDENREAYQEVRNKYLERLADEQDYIIKVLPSGHIPKAGLDVPDSFFQNILRNGSARYNKDNRFFAGRYYTTKRGNYIVVVTASDPHGFKELEQLQKVLVIGFLVSVAITYLGGRVFYYYAIKPVRNIIKSVQNITANNLHLRLDEVGGEDEVSELVFTFNNMLTRLETAFETQNNFVSNASHELRTPLSIITGETELLLAEKGLSDSARKSAEAILKESDKLGQILTSLLGLAQTGFDGKKQKWQKIRIDELVMNVTDSVKKIEPESTLDVDFSALPEDESQVSIEGNINLLRLAISNIVMNACKYSNNQLVTVRVSSENGMVCISTTDRGIGIPSQEQQHVFEPFFRASNTSNYEGYGIGLPLTLNIIRLHKGTIGIRSEESKGTEIRVLLPVMPAS